VSQDGSGGLCNHCLFFGGLSSVSLSPLLALKRRAVNFRLLTLPQRRISSYNSLLRLSWNRLLSRGTSLSKDPRMSSADRMSSWRWVEANKSAGYQDWLKAGAGFTCVAREWREQAVTRGAWSGEERPSCTYHQTESGSLPGCPFWAVLLWMTHVLDLWSLLNVCVWKV